MSAFLGGSSNQKKPRGFLNEAVWPNRITIRQDPISDSYAVETRPFARGKFATVRRCCHIESGRYYAAKYLRKRRRSEDVRHELIHEALVLALADTCERIVSLKEIFETPMEVILVLEMAAGGELQHVLDAEDSLSESSVRRLLVQIAEGLAFLHSQHIAHLDIKPANLLLSASWPDGDAKLCDFGISRLILPGEEIHEIAGTPDYIAPEVLQYEPISLATDLWSVGILTYVLLTGHTPFGGDTKQDTYCNITLGKLDFPQELFEDVSDEAVHFITQLVVKDPRKRLTIGEVLKHPWLTQALPSASSMSISSVLSATNEQKHLVDSCSESENGNHNNNKNVNNLKTKLVTEASMGSLDQNAADISQVDALNGQRRSVDNNSNDDNNNNTNSLGCSDSHTEGDNTPPADSNSINNHNCISNPLMEQSNNNIINRNEGVLSDVRGGVDVTIQEPLKDKTEIHSNEDSDDVHVVPNANSAASQLEQGQTTEPQLIEVLDTSDEGRVSTSDSASSAPEEELPSLQSSTSSSSSSDSPVPAKKDKECEARPPKETPKPRKSLLTFTRSSLTVGPKSSSLFGLPSSGRAQQHSPVDYPSSLSPQVSPTLRRSVALPYPTRLPSMRPLTRSTSVSPVRSVLPSKPSLVPSKSLSATPTSHQPVSFKLTNSQSSGVPTAHGRKPHVHLSSLLPPPSLSPASSATAAPSLHLHTSSHTPSAFSRRTPFSSLKRPQPTTAPKQPKTQSATTATTTSTVHSSHSHNNSNNSSTHAFASHKTSATPRPSLLSPTVSSALKSCAVPLRAVNSLSRTDCEVHGHAHQRRSLVLTSTSPLPTTHCSGVAATATPAVTAAQENKGSPINAKQRSSLPERTLKKAVKTNSPSISISTTGSGVARRSSVLVDGRSKTTASRKSMDLEGLRRKPFADDMLVC